jgi:hypothetical protein
MRLFGPITGRRVGRGRRHGDEKLHNKEIHNSYSSPNSITILCCRWMRWVGHVKYGKTHL